MYVKAFAAYLVVLALADAITFRLLSEKERMMMFPDLPLYVLSILGMVLVNVVFLVTLRGFVGHLERIVALKKALIFFLVVGAIINGLGTIYGLPVLVAVLMTVIPSLGNAASAYFLGKSPNVK